MPPKGLTDNEVLRQQQEFGQNILETKEKLSAITIFISQFKNPFIAILFLATLFSLYSREFTDVLLITVVIIINAFMGFYQEYNAEKTLLALKKILRPKTIVIRQGKRKQIETSELVPGDLVILGSGDKVPADGKLISPTALLVNEAILTGEEEAVTKTEKDSLYMGTTLVAGSGLMIIDKIGNQTEIGKIGKSLEEIKDEKTPLQKKLEIFSRNLVFIISALCFSVFIIGVLFDHRSLWGMLQISVILSVAAIPEGLPIAITIIMILGMRRILKKQGLVKKLLSIETLGSTSVICTDKTGTLTEGIMRVVKTDFINPLFAPLALILTHDQRTNLEVALWEHVKNEENMDPQQIFENNPRLYQEPFDSEKKYSLTINQVNNQETSFLLGAPEIILSFCQISPEEKQKALQKLQEWADEGLRVLGLAFKEDKNRQALKEKRNFSWLGLIGIEDPLRKEVKESIAIAQQAGIKIKIITGDYLKTATRVARDLGFKINPENVLEGEELEIISEEELKKRIDGLIVFSRVSPHQKLKIIKALQEKGEVVAMTGDGVNDAPALKKADIGVVVGNGSDVAKEAGDLILLDNNFQTIISAVEEGRLVFANLKKVVAYVLSNSFAEIFLIFGAMLFRLPLPLTIVQILWIHLICDGPPDILLSFEPKEKALMKKPPQKIQKEELLSGSAKFLVFSISLLAGSSALFFFWISQKTVNNLALSQTLAFAILASIDLIYIFSFKDLNRSVFKTESFLANKYLFAGVAYGFLLLSIAIYLPGLNRILGTVPLNLFHWFIVLTVGLITTLLVEAVKYFNSKFSRL